MTDNERLERSDTLINEIVEQMTLFTSKATMNGEFNDVLNKVFNNTTLTNAFMKNKELFKLMFHFITTTKSKDFYELVDYGVGKYNELIQQYNNFKFNNGLFEDLKLDELEDKYLNTVLIYNDKPTKNKLYNEILDNIKYYDIKDFKFEDYFNDIFINSISNEYNFNFLNNIILKSKEQIKHDIQIKYLKIKNLSFKYINLMDKYILKYNDNSKLFKQTFYLLLCYVYNKTNLKFTDLLNIFLNFNILNYYKLININTNETNLITYLYFKNGNVYIPNLRYTIDLKGENTNEKIKQLKINGNCKVEGIDNLGFNTTILSGEDGIKFSTKEYDINTIIENCDKLINNKEYNKLVYYLFNSQFLNRSTCLFTYFIYFYFTHRIFNNNHYYDILALTRTFKEFDDILNLKDSYMLVEEFENLDNLTLKYIIDSFK